MTNLLKLKKSLTKISILILYKKNFRFLPRMCYIRALKLTFKLAMITGDRYVKIIKNVDIFSSGLIEYELGDATIYDVLKPNTAPNQDRVLPIFPCRFAVVRFVSC